MPNPSDYTQLKDGTWALKERVSNGKPLPETSNMIIPLTENLSNILNNLATFIRKFVILSEPQIIAIALWVIHTFAFDWADATPYLNIHSPEKRSGKTRLLETLELLTNKPWLTGHVTAAVLTRKVDAECPTLLLDESDAAFKADKEYSETLRALLNTGYRRGGKSSICVGQGTKINYKDLSTFCPKAIAGIGKLPDTIADRSIPIVLKRRKFDENIERFRRKVVEAEAFPIRKSIERWVTSIKLGNKEPDIPSALDDRAADCWEPLLSIADLAGGNWPNKARDAAITLMTGEIREDYSTGVRLLADIRTVFSNKQEMSTAALVEGLKLIEEAPWNDVEGRPLDARKLATLLKPYGIRPQSIRIDDKTPKGYKLEDLKDSFSRYLSVPEGLSATSATQASSQNRNNDQISPPQILLQSQNVADNRQVQMSLNVADVAVKTPNREINATNRQQWGTEI